jgi:hypothetical protein
MPKRPSSDGYGFRSADDRGLHHLYTVSGKVLSPTSSEASLVTCYGFYLPLLPH